MTDFVAFIDESEPRQDVDPGTYLLTAAIFDRAVEQVERDRMSSARPRGAAKAHWHDEVNDGGRRRLVNALAALRVEYVVVVRLGDPSVKAERRRRLCLERLSFELHEMRVEQAVFESRGPSDKFDRKLVDALRAKRTISARLRVDHANGPAEPLLWVPDIVCGAYSYERRGDSRFFEPLRERTTVISI